MSDSNFSPGQLLVLDPKLEYGYGAYPCDIRGNINDIERDIEIAPGQPIMFIRRLVSLGRGVEKLVDYGHDARRPFSLVLVGERYGVLHETYLQPFNPLSLNKETQNGI